MDYTTTNFSHVKENLTINLPILRYTNMASTSIFEFIDKCVRSLNYLKNEGFEIHDLYFQRISEFFDMVSDKLTVKDFNTVQRIKHYINSAMILVNSGYNNKDPSSVISSFYGLKKNIIELGVLKN